ncbi:MULTISPECIES: hypothetical protein [Pseudomonas]|uniref:Uncharacterized protein n=1 Tax=Pseudomonas quercus TaxID=2722792 RepID=A0ABX0YJJ9_9PSED|nr:MULTISPECIES: hypothetical protein [Pseudomonas]MBF7145032.1 hypothetical protein [Pseudomonas sp. LY10J]NJP03630.1 hypothetical protein [Pseudomonas quercus]
MADRAHLIAQAQACGNLFRLGREVEAALQMVDLLDQASLLFAIAPVSTQQAWHTLVVSIFSGQELQDWLGLADDLQYELVALLEVLPRVSQF